VGPVNGPGIQQNYRPGHSRTCRDSQQAYCRTAHPVHRVVEGDVGMRMRVEPMFGHPAFSAFAIVLFQHGHCVGFDVEGGEAEGAFAGEANQVPVNE
jgi:hypothetical protein